MAKQQNPPPPPLSARPSPPPQPPPPYRPDCINSPACRFTYRACEGCELFELLTFDGVNYDRFAGAKCPNPLCGRIRVPTVTTDRKGGVVLRWHRCPTCGYRFKSVEHLPK